MGYKLADGGFSFFNNDLTEFSDYDTEFLLWKHFLKLLSGIRPQGEFEAFPDVSRIRIGKKDQGVSNEEGVDPPEACGKNGVYKRLSFKS
jgi:hypothetical protein